MTALRTRARLPFVPASAALILCQPAWAQAPAPPPSEKPEAGDKHIYLPADFARFAPHTAFDMLAQVPGFSIQYASQDRGLGQASENVLLNGQRVTNKSGGAVAELQKISAKQVERIEIVDAASLDIAGLSGQVANIVISAQNKGSGQFNWYPSVAAHFAAPVYTSGDISYSGKQGRVDYTVGLDSQAGASGSGGPATLFDATGQPLEYREEVSKYRQDMPKASARFTLSGPVAGSAGLSYQYVGSRSTDFSARNPLSGPPSSRLSDFRVRGSNLEVSGDFSFKLLDNKLKFIGLFTRQDSPSVATGITITAGAPASGEKVSGDSLAKEMVGRAEYGWKIGGADVQLSAEAAYNSLAGSSRLFALDTVGAYVEVPFPGATLKVAEDRYELLATYDRHLTNKLTLQLVGGGEQSTLAAGTFSRSFLRYKGSASLGWKADARTDVSLKLSRVVEQLYFGEFLASINLVDERQNAGNTRLVPPQSWNVELETTHKLGGWGSTRIKLYSRRTEDIIETIPIGDRDQALGNLDHASFYGVEWQNTLLFDPIGAKGVKLDTTLTLQHSQVQDPLTGMPRSTSYATLRSISVSLRHDIPGSHWAWGSYLSSYSNAPSFQLTEIDRYANGPVNVGGYVENKDILGLKVRASVDNLADARNRRDRIVYDGWRTDPVLFHEVRNRLVGPTFSLGISGNF